VAMGPWLAYSIATQQWPVAVALTAAAGVSEEQGYIPSIMLWRYIVR
jgi:hypothetical protein